MCGEVTLFMFIISMLITLGVNMCILIWILEDRKDLFKK